MIGATGRLTGGGGDGDGAHLGFTLHITSQVWSGHCNEMYRFKAPSHESIIWSIQLPCCIAYQ